MACRLMYPLCAYIQPRTVVPAVNDRDSDAKARTNLLRAIVITYFIIRCCIAYARTIVHALEEAAA